MSGELFLDVLDMNAFQGDENVLVSARLGGINARPHSEQEKPAFGQEDYAGGEDEAVHLAAEEIVNDILGVGLPPARGETSQTSTVGEENAEDEEHGRSSQETLCGTEEQQSGGDLMQMSVEDSPLPPFQQPPPAAAPSPWTHFPPSQQEPIPTPAAASPPLRLSPSPSPLLESSSFPSFDSLDDCAKALLSAVQANDVAGRGAARKDAWFKSLSATFGSARVGVHLSALLDEHRMLELVGGRRGLYCLARGLPLQSLPPPTSSPPHQAAAQPQAQPQSQPQSQPQAQPQAKAKARGRGRGRAKGTEEEEGMEEGMEEGEEGVGSVSAHAKQQLQGHGQGRETGFDEEEQEEEDEDEDEDEPAPKRKRPRANVSSSTTTGGGGRGGRGRGRGGGRGRGRGRGRGAGGRQHYPIPKSAPAPPPPLPQPQGRRTKSARTRAAAAAAQHETLEPFDLADPQGLQEMMACTDLGAGQGWLEQQDLQELQEQQEQDRPKKQSLAQHLRKFAKGHTIFISDSVPAAPPLAKAKPKAKAKAKAKDSAGAPLAEAGAV